MNKKGFTLVELLIVIAIIGIIAAIAIPNLLTALQKGKQKATMGDIKSIGTGVESYITDVSVAPDAADYAGLRAVLQPFHIKKAPDNDGWGNQFQYTARAGNQNDAYSVGSGGRDGSTVDWVVTGEYICDSLGDFNNDICYSAGQFVFFPKVK